VFAIGLNAFDQRLEQSFLLFGEAILVGGHAGGGDRGGLDDLADAALVDGFDRGFGRLDVVGKPADLVGGERVGRALGGSVALADQLLDELASVLVEGGPEILQARGLSFPALDALEFFQVHSATFSARPRAMRNTPSASST
jgi:hypothetical protein